MERIIAYIDGFNLYFGMKSKGWQRYYWLNIHLLAQSLLKPNQQLMCTKYFTSRVASVPADPKKHKRQGIYLEALGTLPNLDIFYGHYLPKEMHCKRCGSSWKTHEEKMTDVNISVELIKDAFQNKFDMALLISGDSDLVHPVQTIRHIFPIKRIVVGFPPERQSRHLKQVANACLAIGRKKIADSLLPNEVRKSDGYILRCPHKWR